MFQASPSPLWSKKFILFFYRTVFLKFSTRQLYTSYSRCLCCLGQPGGLWANMTSSTKPEVHNVLQSHKRRTESRPPDLSYLVSFLQRWKLVKVLDCGSWDMIDHTHTHTHTAQYIAPILVVGLWEQSKRNGLILFFRFMSIIMFN